MKEMLTAVIHSGDREVMQQLCCLQAALELDLKAVVDLLVTADEVECTPDTQDLLSLPAFRNLLAET